MSCTLCPNPALCNPVCRAFDFAPAAVRAQMREACAASGQMTAQEVSAHVEAGEMPDACETERDCQWEPWCRIHSNCRKAVEQKRTAKHLAAAPKGEAGEMDAAKGDRK